MSNDENLRHLVALSQTLIIRGYYTACPNTENPTGLIYRDGKTLVSLAAAKILSDLIEQSNIPYSDALQEQVGVSRPENVS